MTTDCTIIVTYAWPIYILYLLPLNQAKFLIPRKIQVIFLPRHNRVFSVPRLQSPPDALKLSPGTVDCLPVVHILPVKHYTIWCNVN